MRLTAGPAAMLAAWVLAPGLNAAAPALHVRIHGPSPLYPGDAETVDVRAHLGPVRVDAVAPDGRALRVALRRVGKDEWRGLARVDAAGRWRIRAVAGTAVVQLPLKVLPLTTPSPAGFGPRGRPGCTPPSPRHRSPTALKAAEVFGTATRGEFWGLFAFLPASAAWESESTAVLGGIAGQRVKIVFRETGAGKLSFYTVAPDGSRVAPVSGPTFHTSSSWTRPGIEWGVELVFAQTGCWRIHSNTGRTSGDIWLSVRS